MGHKRAKRSANVKRFGLAERRVKGRGHSRSFDSATRDETAISSAQDDGVGVEVEDGRVGSGWRFGDEWERSVRCVSCEGGRASRDSHISTARYRAPGGSGGRLFEGVAGLVPVVDDDAEIVEEGHGSFHVAANFRAGLDGCVVGLFQGDDTAVRPGILRDGIERSG